MPDTARCQLVPWGSRHDAQTVQWLSDPAIRESFGITHSVTLEGHRVWRMAHPHIVAWAIEFSARHCGNLLLDINHRHRSAYLQIYIGRSTDQGHGLGRCAMSLALGQAFGPLNLHRIWLHTRGDNLRAVRLYRSLGFREEGVERESLVLPGGGRIDQTRWSLLATEWRT